MKPTRASSTSPTSLRRRARSTGSAIPDDQNLIASYPIATLVGSKYPDDARAFMDFVLSDAGQKVLADNGFLPAP